MSDDIKVKVVSDSSQAQADLKKLSASVGHIEKTTASATSSLAFLAKSVGAAFATFGAISALNKANDALTNIENRIALVTGRTSDLIQVQDKLVKMSMRTRSTLGDSANLYYTFAKSVDKATTSQEDMLEVIESVQKAVAISGSSAETAAASMVQLAQGLQAGALRGEELNSVLEGTPRIAQAIADGMGLTIAQLRAVAAEGLLTGEKVFKALKSQTAKLNDEFGRVNPTFDQAGRVLADSSKRFLSELSRGLGITTAMGAIVFKAANAVEAKTPFVQTEVFLAMSRIRETIAGMFEAGKAVAGVFGAIAYQVKLATPYIVGIGIGGTRALNLFRQGMAALLAGPLNAFTKWIKFNAEAFGQAIGLFKLFGDARIGRAVTNAFKSDSIAEFTMHMRELQNLIRDTGGDRVWGLLNPFTSRTFITKLLDMTVGIRQFANEIRRSLILVGALEGPLIIIGNIRMDKLKAGIKDITSSFSKLFEFAVQPFLYPIVNQIRVALFAIGSFITELGDNVGGRFGQAIMMVGQAIERMVAIDFAPWLFGFKTTLKVFQALDMGLQRLFDGVTFKINPFEDITKSLEKSFRKTNKYLVDSWKATIKAINGTTDGLKYAWEVIKKFCNDVADAFYDVWDKVVGHSYWPDLVEGVIDWAKKLPSTGIAHIKQFVNAVTSHFSNLAVIWKNGLFKFSDIFNVDEAAVVAGILRPMNALFGVGIKTMATNIGMLFANIVSVAASGGFGNGISIMIGAVSRQIDSADLGAKLLDNLAGFDILRVSRIDQFKAQLYYVAKDIQKLTGIRLTHYWKSDFGVLFDNLDTFQRKLRFAFSDLNMSMEALWAGIKLIYAKIVASAINTIGESNPISKMLAKTTSESYLFLASIISWSHILDLAWFAVKAFAKNVMAAFYDIWDKIVGHSYWPDTIEGIIEWAKKLETVAYKYVANFASSVKGLFDNLYRSVINTASFGGNKESLFKGAIDDATTRFVNFGKKAKDILTSVSKFSLSRNLDDLKDPVVKRINPIKEAISNLGKEDFIKFARMMGIAVVAAIGLALAPTAVQISAVGYLARAFVSIVGQGLDKLTNGQATQIFFSELGASMGTAAGFFLKNFLLGIPSMINSMVTVAESFGTAFLDQFGLFGKAIKLLANAVTGGEGGLIGSILFGFGAHFVLNKFEVTKKALAGFQKAVEGFFAIPGQLAKGLKDGNNGSTDGGMLEKILTGNRGKALLLGVTALLAGFTSEVNALQSTLMATPLLLYAIMGPDVAGKVLMDTVRSVMSIVSSIIKIGINKLMATEFATGVMEKIFAGPSDSKFSRLKDKLGSGMTGIFSFLKNMTDANLQKSYKEGGISLGEYLFGRKINNPLADIAARAKAAAGGPQGEIDFSIYDKNKPISNTKQAKMFENDMADAVAPTSLWGKIKEKLSVIPALYKQLIYGTNGGPATAAVEAAAAGATVGTTAATAANAAAAKKGFWANLFGDNSKIAAMLAAVGASITSTIAGLMTRINAMTGVTGIIGRALFGKTGGIAAILILLALVSSKANAATENVGAATTSIFDTILDIGTKMAEILVPIFVLLQLIPDKILHMVASGLMKVGALILGFFTTGILGPLLAIVTVGGALAVWLFGEGDSFFDKLDNAIAGVSKLVGFGGKTSRQKDLENILPNQTIDNTQVGFKEKFANINYSNINAKEFDTIKKLVDRTAELAGKAREEKSSMLNFDGTASVETMKELNKTMEQLNRVLEKYSGKTQTDFDSASRGIDAILNKDRRTYLPQASIGDAKDQRKLEEVMPGFAGYMVNAGIALTNVVNDKLLNPLIKKFAPNPQKYTAVGEEYNKSDPAVRDLMGFLDQGQQKEYATSVVNLKNAMEALENVKGYNSEKYKKKLKDELDLQLKLYKATSKDLIAKGTRNKQVKEYQDSLTDLQASFKDMKVDIDLDNLFKVDQSTIDELVVIKSALKNAIDARGKAGSTEEGNAAQDLVNNYTETVKRKLESAATANKVQAGFQLLIDRSGAQVEMNDLIQLSTPTMKEAVELMDSMATRKQRMADIKFDNFEEAKRTLRFMAEDAEKLKNLLLKSASREVRIATQMENVAQGATPAMNAATMPYENFAFIQQANELRDTYKKFTETKDEAERDSLAIKMGVENQYQIDPVRMRNIIEENAAIVKDLTDKYAFKKATTGITDLFGRAGFGNLEEALSRGTEQFFNVRLLAKEVSDAKKELDNLARDFDASGNTIFKDPIKAQELQNRIAEGQLLAKNYTTPFTSRFSEVLSNAGASFDISKFAEIDPSNYREINTLTGSIAHLKRERDKIVATGKDGLLPTDKKSLADLQYYNQEIEESTERLKRFLDTNIVAKLGILGGLSGQQLSEKDYVLLGKNEKSDLGDIYKEYNKLLETKKNLEATKDGLELVNDAKYQDTVKKIDKLGKRAANIIGGELTIMSQRAGIEVPIELIPNSDAIQRAGISSLLGNITEKREQLAILDKKPLISLTDADVKRMKSLRDEISAATVQMLNMDAASSKTIGDVERVMSKGGMPVDALTLGKLDPARLREALTGTAKLAQLQEALKNSSIQDLATRQGIVEQILQQQDALKAINREGERKQAIQSDFLSGTKEFMKDFVSGSKTISDSLGDFVIKVADSITTSFIDQIGDFFFKDIAKGMGEFFGASFFDGSSPQRATWVQMAGTLKDTLGLGDLKTGDGKSPAESMFKQVTGGIGDFIDKLKGGFSEIIAGLGKGISGLFGAMANSGGGGGGLGLFADIAKVGMSLYGMTAAGGVNAPGGASFGADIGFDEMVIDEEYLANMWSGLSADTGGVVPGALGSPKLVLAHSGETILPTHKQDIGMGGQQTINISITGDISNQTRKEIMTMLPQIAAGVNQHNYESGYRR